MKALKKLSNNILSKEAITVLGLRLYIQYIGSFITLLPKILRSHDLCLLDKAMGLRAKKFNYKGNSFLFDCKYCDDQLQEDSFAFGTVREIYIRDCYLKFHKPGTFSSTRTVLDLGANRGVFSCMMASQADYVISVEAQPQYVPVIQHNMRINGFDNYAIECGYVGTGGFISKLGESNYEKLTIESILERHDLNHIDLIKLDIEGSEFALFKSPDWLKHVGMLTMEVHRNYGDPQLIIDTLISHKFEYILADENLQRLENAQSAGFIYAWKQA